MVDLFSIALTVLDTFWAHAHTEECAAEKYECRHEIRLLHYLLVLSTDPLHPTLLPPVEKWFVVITYTRGASGGLR